MWYINTYRILSGVGNTEINLGSQCRSLWVKCFDEKFNLEINVCVVWKGSEIEYFLAGLCIVKWRAVNFDVRSKP